MGKRQLLLICLLCGTMSFSAWSQSDNAIPSNPDSLVGQWGVVVVGGGNYFINPLVEITYNGNDYTVISIIEDSYRGVIVDERKSPNGAIFNFVRARIDLRSELDSKGLSFYTIQRDESAAHGFQKIGITRYDKVVYRTVYSISIEGNKVKDKEEYYEDYYYMEELVYSRKNDEHKQTLIKK